MNQNSIIRRIDDLGRIVVPKNLRTKLHINSNDLVELYIDSNNLIIKKYDLFDRLTQTINGMVKIGKKVANSEFIVINKDAVLSSSNSIFFNNNIKDCILQLVDNKSKVENEYIDDTIDGHNLHGYLTVYPIVFDSDKSGYIVQLSETKVNTDIIKVFSLLIENALLND